LLALLAGFLLALLCAELLFRLASRSLGVAPGALAEYRLFVARGHASLEPRPHTVYGGRGNSLDRNSLGFRGGEWELEKRDGVVRILCLGSSTTQGGNKAGSPGSYPALLERGLREQGLEVEVFNAGIAGWTSAEELVCWFLTLQDYSPDLVVIHEAINDVHPRLMPGFRPDYVHWRHAWELPRFGLAHRTLTRFSDLYAWLFARRTELGIFALTTYGPPPETVTLQPETARAFARNVRSIGESAQRLGAGVLLLTMPLRKSDAELFAAITQGTHEHNQILRDLAAEEGWMLADAERVMENSPELQRGFNDLCHLTPEGNKAKAQVVIETLLREWPPARLAGDGR